jgi:hypothetical protein
MAFFEAWMKRTFGRVRSAEGMVGRQPFADVTANGVGFPVYMAAFFLGFCLGFFFFRQILSFLTNAQSLGL